MKMEPALQGISQLLDISCNTIKQKISVVSQGVNVRESDMQEECPIAPASNLRMKSIGVQTERDESTTLEKRRVINSNVALPVIPQEMMVSENIDNSSNFQVLVPVQVSSSMLELKLQHAHDVLNIPEVPTMKNDAASSHMSLASESRRELWRSCRNNSKTQNEDSSPQLMEESSDDSDYDRPHRCTVCKKSFLEKHHLKRHMMIHSGERPFQCFLCSKSFTQKSHLERHVFVHSKWSDSSKCDGSILTDLSNFKPESGQCKTNENVVMKDSAEDMSSRQCTVCHKTFINRYHLRRHMLIHLGVRPFQCQLCNKCFTQKEHLQRHILTHSSEINTKHVHHVGDVEVFPLAVKESINQDIESVSETESEHSEENSNSCTASCPVCHKVFLQKHNIKRHMMIHTGERPFSCTTCKKLFNQAQHLERHILTHASVTGSQIVVKQEPVSLQSSLIIDAPRENNETFTVKMESEGENVTVNSGYPSADFCNQCSVCQKIFASKYHLRRHLLIHSGERPYQCPICLKSFTQREHLERHVRTHSFARSNNCNYSNNINISELSVEEEDAANLNVASPTSTIKVECVLECDKSDESNTNSNESVEQTSELSHRCIICNKILSNKYHLKRHMLIHSGERPFQCQMCPKNFTQKCHLERHMFTHSAVRCGIRETAVLTPKVPEIKSSTPTAYEFLKAITESAANFKAVSSEELETFKQEDDSVIRVTDSSSPENCAENAKVCSGDIEKEMFLDSLVLVRSGNKPDMQQENRAISGVRHFLEDVVVCLPGAESATDADSDDNGNFRPHECSVCHKTFIQKHHLKRHLMIHNNERPFQCEQCGKAFNQKQHVEKHIIKQSCTKSTVDSRTSSEGNVNSYFDSKGTVLAGLENSCREADNTETLTEANSSKKNVQMDTENVKLKVDKNRFHIQNENETSMSKLSILGMRITEHKSTEKIVIPG